MDFWNHYYYKRIYTINKIDRFRTKEKIMNADPRNIIPFVVVIILAIWFAIGIFPIKPFGYIYYKNKNK